MNGENVFDIEKRLELAKEIQAPVEKGQLIGKLFYYHGDKKLGDIGILASESVDAAKYMDYVKRVWLAWMM